MKLETIFAEISGIGLNSGQECTVEFSALSKCENQAPHWVVKNENWGALTPLLRNQQLEIQSPRTTLLCAKNTCLRTPEHIAAALLPWAKQSIQVHVKNGEIPLLDGSALPWFNALQSAFGEPRELCFYDCPIEGEMDFGYGYLKYAPNVQEGLRIEASISYTNSLGHVYTDRYVAHIVTVADLLPILNARTFIFLDDFNKAKQAGQFAGAQEESGLLLDVQQNTVEILVGAPFRHAKEPILHKILDLVGDLSLLGAQLPRLSIQIHNGGHAVHQQLLQRIMPYVIN